MASIKGKFTVKIPRTTDLVPPDLEVNWEAEFEGDPKYEKTIKTRGLAEDAFYADSFTYQAD